MTGNSVLGVQWHRRRLLTVIGAAGAGSLALPAGTTMAAPTSRPAAAPATRTWTRSASQNGWPVIDSSSAPAHRVEGSNASVALLGGDVATVLLHVARRYHYEVERLIPGSVSGHRTNRRMTVDYESNFLSGTALAVWPDRYPPGVRGGLFAHQVAIVRDILAECDGVVRWAGDQRAKPSEGHFQIDVRPGNGRLIGLAERIRGWEAKPGKGAGVPSDIFSPARRRAATQMETRQRPSS